LTTDIINSFKKNEDLILKNPDMLINIINTKDICRALIKILNSKTSDIVNIATKNNITIINYARRILEHFPKYSGKIFFKKNNNTNKVKYKIITKKLKKIKFFEKYNLRNGIKEILI
jgi:nucleoside-diphosphate-sugar epimerase